MKQTPKDFEAYLEQMGYSWNDFDHTYQIKGLVEQYVQAKVLEALDVIKTLVYNNVTVTGEHVENLIRSKTKV